MVKAAYRVWPGRYSNQVLRCWRNLVSPLGVDRKFVQPHDAMSDSGAVFRKKRAFTDMCSGRKEPMLFTKFKQTQGKATLS